MLTSLYFGSSKSNEELTRWNVRSKCGNEFKTVAHHGTWYSLAGRYIFQLQSQKIYQSKSHSPTNNCKQQFAAVQLHLEILSIVCMVDAVITAVNHNCPMFEQSQHNQLVMIRADSFSAANYRPHKIGFNRRGLNFRYRQSRAPHRLLTPLPGAITNWPQTAKHNRGRRLLTIRILTLRVDSMAPSQDIIALKQVTFVISNLYSTTFFVISCLQNYTLVTLHVYAQCFFVKKFCRF